MFPLSWNVERAYSKSKAPTEIGNQTRLGDHVSIPMENHVSIPMENHLSITIWKIMETHLRIPPDA